MTPEGAVKRDIHRWLEAEGLIPAAKVPAALAENIDFKGWYYMPVASMYSVKGVPDFIGIWRSVGFGIEAKAKGGKPTDNQTQQIAAVRQAGGICCVIDHVSQLADFKSAMEALWKKGF